MCLHLVELEPPECARGDATVAVDEVVRRGANRAVRVKRPPLRGYE